MLDDAQLRWDHLQLLADLFTDLGQRATAGTVALFEGGSYT